MLYGISEGVKVRAKDAVAGSVYKCPCCNSIIIPVVPVCDIIDHWRHKSLNTCDNRYSNGESEWHTSMKEMFNAQYVEVVNGNTVNDVLFPTGVAVEFQNSSITAREIERRQQYAKKTIWVFNIQQQFDNGQFFTTDDNCFEYSHPKKIFRHCNVFYWYADGLIFEKHKRYFDYDTNEGGYRYSVMKGTYKPMYPKEFAAMITAKHEKPMVYNPTFEIKKQDTQLFLFNPSQYTDYE